MKFLALLTPFLLGATASPVKERQTTSKVAYVSSFEASYIKSTLAYISYDVKIGDAVDTHCEYLDESQYPAFTAFGQVYCDDPAVRWQFNEDPAGPGARGRFRIVIIYTSGSPSISEAGWNEWQATQFPEDADGNIEYIGSPEFTVTIPT